jgi:hypothetical protein
MARSAASRTRQLPLELRLIWGTLKLGWWLLVCLFALVGAMFWLIGRPFRSPIEVEPDPLPADEFYRSYRWRRLRIDVLEGNRERYGKLTCECCLTTATAQWHVDHIHPRSLYPDLALEAANLQVLCKDCNLGKRDRYVTDWRFEP